MQCRSRLGKGQVEKVVQDARNGLWHQAPRFANLDELNHWLEEQCKIEWQKTRHVEHADCSIADVWLEERRQLMTKPADLMVMSNTPNA